MRPELVDVVWKRRRGFRRVHVLAVLTAVVAPAVLIGLFNQFGRAKAGASREPQVIASIDLRIGNPIFAAQQGEAEARKDIEAGLFQLQTFEAAPQDTPAGRARTDKLNKLYGISWLHKVSRGDPAAQAYVDAYNLVVQAEIERKFGPEFLQRLLRGEDPGPPKPGKAASS